MSDLLRGAAPMTTARGISGSYLPPIYRNQLVRAESLHPDDLKRLTDWGYLVPESNPAAVPAAAMPAVIGHDDEVFFVDNPTGDEKPLTVGPERDPNAKADADKAKADADLAEKRAAAKAKLPADGSAPDGRLGQPVWVEYLVSKGSNYDDVQSVDKDQLVALAKQQSA
jgi:hypothetical protein